MGFTYDWKHSEPNHYICDCGCKEQEEISAEPTEYGAPSHYRKCKKCGYRDGPWIRLKIIGQVDLFNSLELY